jgi:co-chaperonin GroES (HSP10)
MKLRPLQDSFIFEFTNETVGGRFVENHKSGIILTHQDLSTQADRARWGKVLAIGEKVTDFEVNDLVLIEYGKWTTSITFEDKKYWRSAQDFVCAISNDESITYSL